MKKKSLGLQIFLTLLFGPLGLLYSAPGMVIPLVIGAFVIIAIAAMSNMGGGAGALILLGIYIAPFVIGFNAVENHNLAVDSNEKQKRETEERRHQELLAASKVTTPSPSTSETKPCPYCAETILVAAIKCKHCGSELT